MPDKINKRVEITREEARAIRTLINGYFDDVQGDTAADDELTDTLGDLLAKLNRAFS